MGKRQRGWVRGEAHGRERRKFPGQVPPTPRDGKDRLATHTTSKCLACQGCLRGRKMENTELRGSRGHTTTSYLQGNHVIDEVLKYILQFQGHVWRLRVIWSVCLSQETHLQPRRKGTHPSPCWNKEQEGLFNFQASAWCLWESFASAGLYGVTHKHHPTPAGRHPGLDWRGLLCVLQKAEDGTSIFNQC